MRVSAYDKNNAKAGFTIDYAPNQCPYCHTIITPIVRTAYVASGNLRVIYHCPNIDCEEVFVGLYGHEFSDNYSYSGVTFGRFVGKVFSAIINEISPTFIEIYNQAEFSEEHNLKHISGVAYRKALEFLIKDYLIKLKPDSEEKIKKKFLGYCIKEDIDNTNLKTVAERAAWLGNDETHYIRKWEDKDITDLKRLIDLTVHWIEMEEQTKKYLEEMPQ